MRRGHALTSVASIAALLGGPAATGAAQDDAEVRDIAEFACSGEYDRDFPDTEGNVHEEAIRCLASFGIAQGNDDGEFEPAADINRGQMATFLANTLRYATSAFAEPTDAGFSDVGDDHPHAISIDVVAAAGITEGSGNNRFEPARTVTRGQMAAFLARTVEFLAGEPLPAGDDAFEDDDGTTFERDIDAIAAAGLAAGTDGGDFEPARRVERGAMASFVMRTVDLGIETGVLFPRGITSIALAALDGEAEIDGDGDPDATGYGQVYTTDVSGVLCADLRVDLPDDDPAVEAHVHAAPRGENGDVVVPLATPEDGRATACQRLDPALADEIADAPDDHYVNVHTDEYPDGAVRGQLGSITDQLTAELDGEHVVDDGGEDGAGDPDGLGFVDLVATSQDDTVCADVVAVEIASPRAAHVDAAPSGENGEQVLDLPTPEAIEGDERETLLVGFDCMRVEPELRQEILDDPESHAAVVDNDDFEDGALRGQLRAFDEDGDFDPAEARATFGMPARR